MNCAQLAARIQELQPDADPREVAKLCLLLSNTVADVTELGNDEVLAGTWHDISLRLQAATDQHEAMTEELQILASSDPRRFEPDQIWVLIRAIKVQSQVLQMYVGGAALDV